VLRDCERCEAGSPGRLASGRAWRGWLVRLLLIAAVALAGLSAGCVSRSADGVTPTSGSLTLLDSQVGSGTCDALEITGHVQNRGRAAVSHVTVDIAILDAHGAKIGNAVAATDDMRPDAVWAFKASSTVRGATDARVLTISDR
jgi:hypothetical protein